MNDIEVKAKPIIPILMQPYASELDILHIDNLLQFHPETMVSTKITLHTYPYARTLCI